MYDTSWISNRKDNNQFPYDKNEDEYVFLVYNQEERWRALASMQRK